MSRETDERPDERFEVMWPYSLNEFKKSSIGLVAMRAIKERADEIIHAADTGEPPLGAMLPAFHISIDESHDWRMIERMIHEWLGPSYLRPGRKRIPISVYRNGFSDRERYRTAELSKWLVSLGCTDRAPTCDICRNPADDEHAENYYDLTSWIGLCRRCHRSSLHGRFQRPGKWLALLDYNEVGSDHWSRLISSAPFDLAALLRARGWQEPMKLHFSQ